MVSKATEKSKEKVMVTKMRVSAHLGEKLLGQCQNRAKTAPTSKDKPT
jgi:hypothetical protein